MPHVRTVNAAPPDPVGVVPRLRNLMRDERVRFLVVGTFNTAFAYVVFAALILTVSDTFHYTLILIASHVITVLTAYVAYRFVVFRVRGRFFRDLPRFWVVYLAALAVNLVLLPLLVEVLDIHVLIAQGLVAILAALNSYLGHKHFSFRRSLPRSGGTDG